MQRLGRLVPEPDDLRWCIGPPLKSAFRVLLDTDDDPALDEAVRLYRERYATVGKFENVLIPGVPEALSILNDGAVHMAVATSKLESYAGDIIDHFSLRGHFSGVHGSRADGSNSAKADLIAHILASESLDPARTIMIGDRSHDVVGAAANGVAAIGVLWGFGDRDELTTAGAAAIAETPGDLPGIVARLTQAR